MTPDQLLLLSFIAAVLIVVVAPAGMALALSEWRASRAREASEKKKQAPPRPPASEESGDPTIYIVPTFGSAPSAQSTSVSSAFTRPALTQPALTQPALAQPALAQPAHVPSVASPAGADDSALVVFPPEIPPFEEPYPEPAPAPKALGSEPTVYLPKPTEQAPLKRTDEPTVDLAKPLAVYEPVTAPAPATDAAPTLLRAGYRPETDPGAPLGDSGGATDGPTLLRSGYQPSTEPTLWLGASPPLSPSAAPKQDTPEPTEETASPPPGLELSYAGPIPEAVARVLAAVNTPLSAVRIDPEELPTALDPKILPEDRPTALDPKVAPEDRPTALGPPHARPMLISAADLPEEIELPADDDPSDASDLPTEEYARSASVHDDTLSETEVNLVVAARRLPGGIQGIEPLRDALAIAKKSGDPERIGRAEIALATGLLQFGRDADARRILEGASAAWNVPSADLFLRLRLQAQICARAGDIVSAERWWVDAHTLASAFESRPDQALSLAGEAELSLLRGEIAPAKAGLMEAVGLLDERSPIDALAEVYALSVDVERALGCWEDARGRAVRLCDVSLMRADLEVMALGRALLASVLAEKGLAEAGPLAREAIQIALQAGRPADGALRRAVRTLCDFGSELPDSLLQAEPAAIDPIHDGVSAWLALQARSWARSDPQRTRSLVSAALSGLFARCPLSAFRIRLDAAIALRDAGDKLGASDALEQADRAISRLDVPLPGLLRESAKVRSSLLSFSSRTPNPPASAGGGRGKVEQGSTG